MKSFFILLVLTLTYSTVTWAGEIENSKNQLIKMRTQGSYSYEHTYIQAKELSSHTKAVDDYQPVLGRIERKLIMKGR